MYSTIGFHNRILKLLTINILILFYIYFKKSKFDFTLAIYKHDNRFPLILLQVIDIF
jgi:hypothetical protein